MERPQAGGLPVGSGTSGAAVYESPRETYGPVAATLAAGSASITAMVRGMADRRKQPGRRVESRTMLSSFDR